MRISHQTAETVGQMALTMGRTGSLPSTEAKAVLQILTNATKEEQHTVTMERPAPGLLTTAEAARLLACCAKTVHRMAADGELSRVYLRPGNAKSLRFRESELRELIDPTAGAREL